MLKKEFSRGSSLIETTSCIAGIMCLILGLSTLLLGITKSFQIQSLGAAGHLLAGRITGLGIYNGYELQHRGLFLCQQSTGYSNKQGLYTFRGFHYTKCGFMSLKLLGTQEFVPNGLWGNCSGEEFFLVAPQKKIPALMVRVQPVTGRIIRGRSI